MTITSIPVEEVYSLFLSYTKMVTHVGVSNDGKLVIEYEEYGEYKLIVLPAPPLVPRPYQQSK